MSDEPFRVIDVGYRDDAAAGAGIATYDGAGRVLDAWFPSPSLGSGIPSPVEGPTGSDAVRDVRTEHVSVRIASLAEAPADSLDVWLRLHLLSHRLIRPHEANLDGIFGLLTNVAWTSLGPIAMEDVEGARLRARRTGEVLQVHGVDKFPRMTDYVVPSGVRIADANRVRLGAYLAPGTTVLHEGFVNFNAGTLGTSMVEGRISQGVVVGDGTDVGGGASIQGTLSGGGTIVVSLGERCLLGANSGVGIPLGNDCVVAAGCYVTAGSKVTLPDGAVVQARELAGVNDMMFWTNTQTGVLEARPRTGKWTGLNEALHTN
jgi:2,3,4,5-tetrahydropyridine-2,6-dicarboxylate N-succinyltransferase